MFHGGQHPVPRELDTDSLGKGWEADVASPEATASSLPKSRGQWWQSSGFCWGWLRRLPQEGPIIHRFSNNRNCTKNKIIFHEVQTKLFVCLSVCREKSTNLTKSSRCLDADACDAYDLKNSYVLWHFTLSDVYVKWRLRYENLTLWYFFIVILC